MSKPAPAKPSPKYVSNGQVLSSPPLTVRIRGFIDHTVMFFGLYLTTLFSLDPHLSARTSAYNIHNRERDGTKVGRGYFGGWGGGDGSGKGGGGGGGAAPRGPGSGGAGTGGRKLGGVDDIRAPECGSCG